MGAILEPEKAILVIGVIAGDRTFLARSEDFFSRFGKVALAGPVWDFAFTRYYEKEMGSDLGRRFFFYEPGFALDDLPSIKLATNELEQELAPETALDVPRPVNIDPGYLTLSRLVLASTKNHSHRIYIGRNIYAEITLHFRDGTYRANPWTYPDYGSAEYIAFFNDARERLLR